MICHHTNIQPSVLPNLHPIGIPNILRPPRSGGGLLRSRPGRIILGILFVAAGLALVFWLTMRVTNWGRQDIPAPPLSLAAMESNEV